MIRVVVFVFVILSMSQLRLVAAPADTLDYMPYYRAMNRAERCIARLQLKTALHVYDSAFGEYPKHRRRDLYNATLCALHSEQPTKAQQWIMEGIARGMTIADFGGDTFRQQPAKFWQPIELCYDSLRAVYLSTAESWAWFKIIIDTMNAREQQVLKAIKAGIMTDCNYDTLRYAHAKQLHRIIDSVGVPTVPMFSAGVDILPSVVFTHHFKLRNSWRDGEFDTLVAPYRDMDMRRYDLEPLLLKAIRNGDIDPEEVYAFAKSDNGGPARTSGVVGTTPYGGLIDCKKKIITCERNAFVDVDRVNAERRKYGLSTVEEAMCAAYELVLFYDPKNYPFEEILQSLAENNCYQFVFEQYNNQRERTEHSRKCFTAKRAVTKRHREKVLNELKLTLGSELPDVHSVAQRMVEFKLPNWRQVYSLWDVVNIKDEKMQ